MSSLLVAPSLLAADFSDMGSALALATASGADWVHLDIMDGRFVPNLTFGPKMAADLRSRSALPFDVHLMTLEPETLVRPFAEAGADWITFHVEATVHAQRLAASIREAGARPGVSLVPSSPLASIEELLPEVDLVLVMSVNPGFGGQVLLPSCLDKVRRLAKIRAERGLAFLISVDGGVNAATLPAVADSGADIVVMGSAFYGSPSPTEAVALAKGLRR